MQIVPAQGACGGGYWIPANAAFYSGQHGINGINRQSGGGGSGGGRNWTRSVFVGRGGYGTSYSGGSGSGAAQSDGGGGWHAQSANAPDNGGQGTNGAVSSSNGSGYAQICMSGQGNPINTYAAWYRAGPSVTPYTDISGTGGLIVIYCTSLINNGFIQSHGGNTMYTYSWTGYICIASGGASGGGSINVFATQILERGSITATGGRVYIPVGAEGGPGGNGCVTVTECLLLFNNGRLNSNYYKNARRQSSFDLLKIIGE